MVARFESRSFIYLSETGERHHGPGAVGHGRRLQGGVEALHVVVLHPQLHVVLQRRDVDLPRERRSILSEFLKATV